MGRKSKYSKELEEKICRLIVEGNTIESICKSVNIGVSTYGDWSRQNPAFSAAIKKAEAERDDFGELLAINTIFSAMKNGIWQAGAWWLERRFPNKYRNVQEQKKVIDIDDAREKLTKLIANAPRRAENS